MAARRPSLSSGACHCHTHSPWETRSTASLSAGVWMGTPYSISHLGLWYHLSAWRRSLRTIWRPQHSGGKGAQLQRQKQSGEMCACTWFRAEADKRWPTAKEVADLSQLPGWNREGGDTVTSPIIVPVLVPVLGATLIQVRRQMIQSLTHGSAS